MVQEKVGWSLPEHVRTEVLEKVMPSHEEMKRIRNVVSDLEGNLQERTDGEAYPMLVGSIAKGTVASMPDIDIFLIFPKDSTDKYLEERGLEIARSVLDSPEKRYTQHPYLTGTFRGFSTDIVPCRRIERGEKVSTAVDRTPFHTEYVTSRMTDMQRKETVLLKSFLKGIGAYGAEDTVGGFSGYLCELLIILKGCFSAIVDWFASMETVGTPPSSMERTLGGSFMAGTQGPEMFVSGPLLCEAPRERSEYLDTFSRDALIVIDPVDPERNVAAPVSDQILARTVSECRRLRADPDERMFDPWHRRPIEHVPGGKKTGKLPHLVSIGLPDDNPDKVMTQARSFLSKIRKHMEGEREWDVFLDHILLFPADHSIDGAYLKARYVHSTPAIEDPLIVVEIRSVPEVPPSRSVHWGPPSDNPRAAEFRSKWGNRTRVYGNTGKLYVVVNKGDADHITMFMNIWERIRKGPSFMEASPEAVENQLIHEVIWEASDRNSDPAEG